jgi:hypothetical protein
MLGFDGSRRGCYVGGVGDVGGFPPIDPFSFSRCWINDKGEKIERKIGEKPPTPPTLPTAP